MRGIYWNGKLNEHLVEGVISPAYYTQPRPMTAFTP